jgi:hypothetical protein
MYIICENAIVLVLLRKLIAICLRCEGQVRFYCFRKFESKGMRFVCGIDDAVVSYVCFNVIHHQIGTITSCTVTGVCQNHVFQLF